MQDAPQTTECAEEHELRNVLKMLMNRVASLHCSFADQQEWDYTAEEMVSTYFKDGVELSEVEGERIMECFNNPVDVEPDKREMTP